MQENSLKCYFEIKETGILGNRQLEVYKLIIENPFQTDRELSFLLDVDSNYIRPRRRDLERLGLIENKGSRRCTISGKTALIWIKKDYNLNKLLEKKKKDKSFWIKRLSDLEQQKRKALFKYFECLNKEQKQLSLKRF